MTSDADLAHCLEACQACALACERCTAACLAELDMRSLSDCIALNLDCAQFCTTTAALLARGSSNAAMVCLTCSSVCNACGNECERHAHEHCRRCAEACRACAQACSRHAAQLDQAVQG